MQTEIYYDTKRRNYKFGSRSPVKLNMDGLYRLDRTV